MNIEGFGRRECRLPRDFRTATKAFILPMNTVPMLGEKIVVCPAQGGAIIGTDAGHDFLGVSIRLED